MKQKKNRQAEGSQHFWRSISFKVAMVLLAAVVVVFSVTGLLIFSYTKSLLISNAEANVETKTEAVSNQVNSMFSEKSAIVRQIASNQQIADYLESAANRDEALTDPSYRGVMDSLNKIVQTDKDVAMVWVASKKGNFLIGNDDLIQDESFDIETRPWYEPALNEEDVYFTEPYMDQVFGKVILSVMKQIKVNGQPYGFVAIDIFLDDLPNIMQTYTKDEDGYTFLLGADGTVLYHPEESHILNDKLQDLEGDLGSIGENMIAGESDMKTVDVNNRKEYIGYAPITSTGWSAAVALPRESALSELSSYTTKMVSYFSIASLFVILIGYVLTRYMLRAIPTITSRLKEMAAGDMTTRIDIQSKDEIGQVADSINTMIESFASTVDHMNDSIERMSASSQQLTAVSVDSVKSSNEAVEAIQEIVRGADQQVEAAEQTSLSMEEMAAGVQKIAESATAVSEQTNGSVTDAENGYREVQKAIEKMKRVKETVGVSAEELKSMEQHSKKIDEMVSGINDIATQIQLLSLNASIEAARAGEHGQGFAVVAEEIKKLSLQSQEFSGNITTIIQDIHSVTSKATGSIEQGVIDVEEGSQILNRSGKVFEHITNAFQSIADQVLEVSSASEQMSAGTEEVTAAMNDISNVTKGSFEFTQGISAGSERQLQLMDNISESAKMLSDMAEEMQDILARFKTK
ncbi:methyl-accepting chemotaxis protein [Lentibacillus saliphilus]|uniref:methyl-accepting chemotaxis protein n=1 Tax=Lentibacillus saliphilus TaxID=2737028 RepID=UPI001C3020AA|nr:methyl-accepting chemotaxis protein [Lentibacillus saliphilus]